MFKQNLQKKSDLKKISKNRKNSDLKNISIILKKIKNIAKIQI